MPAGEAVLRISEMLSLDIWGFPILVGNAELVCVLCMGCVLCLEGMCVVSLWCLVCICVCGVSVWCLMPVVWCVCVFVSLGCYNRIP